MGWGAVFQGVLPLVVYVVVDLLAGLRWGVVAAIGAALVDCGAAYWQSGEVDGITLAASLLIVGMGAVSLATNKAAYIKFQPVLVGVMTALFMAYFQIFKQPFLLAYADSHRALLPVSVREALAQPALRVILAAACGHMIYFILLHAALVAYAAKRMSNVGWLLMRSLGFYAVMAVFLAVEVVMVIVRAQ